MKVLLFFLDYLYIPSVLKKRMIIYLSKITAEAFQCDDPDLKGYSYKETLYQFALFTCRESEGPGKREKEREMTAKRLYIRAYRLGYRLRQVLRIETIDDVMKVSRLLYRILKIDFQGCGEGNITINRCYFSNYYTPEICRFISQIDKGVIAGLSGGGKLEFSQRLTEGKNSCKARLLPGGDCICKIKG